MGGGLHEIKKDGPALVLTRQSHYECSHPTFSSLASACEYAKKKGEEECFVIGGEEIYRLALPYTSKLYLSIVDYEESGDAYFPAHESFDWKTIKNEHHQKDKNTPITWDFFLLEKKAKVL